MEARIKKPPFCVRQGDVCIVAVNSIPVDAKDITGKEIVLMHGEVTHHAHRIAKPKGKAVFLDAQAERYLQVLSEATIKHEEHAPILLRKGKYQQAFQVEDYGTEVRRVAD